MDFLGSGKVPPVGLGKGMSAPGRAREGDGQVRLG